MGQIRILPDNLVNRIAAGEVVARPASVVKELLDNAIDAEARHLEINIERGGRTLIQVIDDGCGMDQDDALLAFERHATSKIHSPQDLANITSLGFRGEALASISAVSHVVLETCRDSEGSGTRVEIIGGRLKSVSPAAMPVGTRVSVQRIFFNVPARRKFLRTIATEFSLIVDLVQHYALAFPEISFRMRHGGRETLFWTDVTSYEQRLKQIFGENWLLPMLPLDLTHEGQRVWGWISLPEKGQRTLDEVNVYVNRRYVRDRWLIYSIRDAWLRYGSHFKHPRVVLFLEVDPSAVDVNVHPTKLEVRFHQPLEIQELIRTAIDQAFQTHRPISSMALPGDDGEASSFIKSVNAPTRLPGLEDGIRLRPYQGGPVSVKASDCPITVQGQDGQGWTPNTEIQPRPNDKEGDDARLSVSYHHRDTEDSPVPPPPADRAGTDTPHRLLGQIFNCYLLVSDDDGLIIMDQHLVHERHLYETWGRERGIFQLPNGEGINRKGFIRSQKLLIPVLIELGPSRGHALAAHKDLLRTWGWEIDAFGTGTVSTYAIPQGLWPNRLEEALLSFLEWIDNPSPEGPEWEQNILKTVACRAAVKKGDRLTHEQMRYLSSIWYTLEVPQICPHGRTMTLRLTADQMHRAFGRNWNL